MPLSIKNNPPLRFLLTFFGLLALLFGIVAPTPVNDGLVEPFTGFVARSAGLVLRTFGEDVRMEGTSITSPRFAVNIRNGCNGLEAIFVFAAAVLAFPVPAKTRLLGLLGGFVLIQLVNLVRIVALFYTGVFFPKFFQQSHVVVWQTIVILAAVSIWVFWAFLYAVPARSKS